MPLAETVTTSELAALLNVAERTLGKLVDKGVLQREGHGTFALGDSVRRYIAHRETVAAAEAAGRSEWATARAALYAERALAAKMKRQELEGELLPRGPVLAWTTSVARAVTARILNTPTKVAPRVVHMKSAGQIEATFREALVEALEEIRNLMVVPDRPARPRKSGDAAA